MIRGRITKEGRLSVSTRELVRMKDFAGSPVEISPILPESRKMRGWFEGGLVPYYAFLHGMNWKSRNDIEAARWDIKDEFYSETRIINGKRKRIPKSTKGRKAIREVTEKLLDYYAENGYISDATDPEKYKYWRDVVLTQDPTAPDNFIDWLIETGALKIQQL